MTSYKIRSRVSHPVIFKYSNIVLHYSRITKQLLLWKAVFMIILYAIEIGILIFDLIRHNYVSYICHYGIFMF